MKPLSTSVPFTEIEGIRCYASEAAGCGIGGVVGGLADMGRVNLTLIATGLSLPTGGSLLAVARNGTAAR